MSDPTGGSGPSGEQNADGEVEDLGIPGIQGAVEIGLGGFGRVYRASQPAFGRTVAVKVLSVGKLDEKSQNRFERECQAMGALSGHPNIVTVFDAGTTADGRPYLIMEYMSGGSYDDRIRAGTLTWEEATEVGAKVSAALQVAHDAGIIHRDIKPANVLISQYGEPQLGDFGIARITGGSETKSGVITASMAHAAPEVLDGARPTTAADVYAVGSMVYEMISGDPAFFSETDETNLAMIRRIYDDPVPDLRADGVPDPVARVIEASMAKKADDRPMTAAALAEQFREALRQADATKEAAEAEAAAKAGAAAAAAAAAAEAVDPSATAAIPAVAQPPGAPAAPQAPAGPPPGAAPPGAPPPVQPAPPPPSGFGAPPPGAPVGPGAPPPGPQPFTTGPQPVPARKGGGSKVPLVVGAVVVLVLVVGAGLAFALTRGGDDGPDPTTTPPTQDQADLPDADPPPDFDDAAFDALGAVCEEGDLVGCDVLYQITPVGSDAEEYGSTCGGRSDEDLDGGCAASDEFTFSLPSAQPPGDLGDDDDLDDLVDECEGGDLDACDDLFLQSEVGSSYEAYGRTCGGRLPAVASGSISGNECADRYGDAEG